MNLTNTTTGIRRKNSCTQLGSCALIINEKFSTKTISE